MHWPRDCICTSWQASDACHKVLISWKQPSCASGAASSSKETELSQSMASLQKELQEAQQQAAQEASHVAQFRSLAEGAEENTKIVQV